MMLDHAPLSHRSRVNSEGPAGPIVVWPLTLCLALMPTPQRVDFHSGTIPICDILLAITGKALPRRRWQRDQSCSRLKGKR
jgi:hypothetical protein